MFYVHKLFQPPARNFANCALFVGGLSSLDSPYAAIDQSSQSTQGISAIALFSQRL
jgi:hypothetical protein